MCFTMLTICWTFLTAIKSHISYLPRYSETATFVPLKAAEAKFFGLRVEDKAFLLQKPTIRSSNTNASAAAQAMMLSRQSGQLSSTHWSPQRWSTFEQHLQKQDALNSLSSHCKLQAWPLSGVVCQHPKCEHRSVAQHVWGGQEGRRGQWCLKL